MRIAVVGAGIAGLTAAARLHPHHDLTLFEAEAQLGGHALTRLVPDAAVCATLTRPDGRGRTDRDLRSGERPTMHAADLGFMVWNHRTYPGLKAMFERLGVVTAPMGALEQPMASTAAGPSRCGPRARASASVLRRAPKAP